MIRAPNSARVLHGSQTKKGREMEKDLKTDPVTCPLLGGAVCTATCAWVMQDAAGNNRCPVPILAQLFSLGIQAGFPTRSMDRIKVADLGLRG